MGMGEEGNPSMLGLLTHACARAAVHLPLPLLLPTRFLPLVVPVPLRVHRDDGDDAEDGIDAPDEAAAPAEEGAAAKVSTKSQGGWASLISDKMNGKCTPLHHAHSLVCMRGRERGHMSGDRCVRCIGQ